MSQSLTPSRPSRPVRQFLPVLPRGTSAAELADQCRSAALGFSAGAERWGKAELAAWLEGSYRPLTLGMPEITDEAPLSRLGPAWAPSIRPPSNVVAMLDARKVEDVIVRARDAAVGVLRSLTCQSSVADFGSFAIRSGLVHRCIDEAGAPGWAPRAKTRLKLADRVLSVFAADCLARPWDYETLLTVCGDCAAVTLVEGWEPGACCNRASGVMRTAEPAIRIVAA